MGKKKDTDTSLLVPGIDRMGHKELMDALGQARERLQDTEETFNFMLANTNDHLADSMVLEFEQDLYEHRDIVTILESRLKDLE